MLTSTAEQNTPTLENKSLLVDKAGQMATNANRKNSLFNIDLKKLYLHTSVLGLVLIICGLTIAISSHNILMTECFKALFIAGSLNLIRAFSIS